METSNSDSRMSSTSGSTPSSPRDPNSLPSSRTYGIQFPPALRYLHSPLSSLLEHSGLLRVRPDHSEADPLIFGGRSNNTDSNFNTNGPVSASPTAARSSSVSSSATNATTPLSSSNGEVSIRIIGPGEGDRVGSDEGDDDSDSAVGAVDGADRSLSGAAVPGDSAADGNGANGNNRGESSYQRYDIQQFARWVEQILPFSLLLLVVFIRQHLQGILNPVLV